MSAKRVTGKRDRRQGALAHQNGVHELDRHMRGVAGLGASSKHQQPSTLLEAPRHGQAGARDGLRIRLEESAGYFDAQREPPSEQRRELARRGRIEATLRRPSHSIRLAFS